MRPEPIPAPPRSLFETDTKKGLEIWDQLQRLQTELAIAQELSFFYTSGRWHKAQTVLDLGTGNGYYLEKLVSRFPEKRFLGVDRSGELIAIAEREVPHPNIRFAYQDIFEVEGRYDFIIMRLLIQHLDDTEKFFDHLDRLSHAGTTALIIDACDPLRIFHPELPEFFNFFRMYAEKEREGGRDRNVATRIETAIASHPVWRPVENRLFVIPSTIHGNLELFVRIYTLLVDLVEQTGKLQYDFHSVRQALHRWSRQPRVYMQVGLHMIGIDHV